MSVPKRSFLRNSRLAIGPRALGWMGVGIGASFVLAAVELFISVFIQLFLKGLGLLAADVKTFSWVDQAQLTATQLGIFLITIAVVRAFCQYVVGQSGNVAMEMINARLRRIAIFEMLLHEEERYVSASVMNARISEYFVKASWFAYAFANLVAVAVQAGALLLVMFGVAWKESLIALVGLFVVGNVVRMLNRKNREVAERVPQELELVTKGIERIARNTTLVRALRTQKKEHGRFADSIDAYARYSSSSGSLGTGAMVLPRGLGAHRAHRGGEPAGFGTASLTLLSFLYLFMRFVQAASAVVTQWSVCAQRYPQFRDSVAYVGGFTEAELDRAGERAPVVGKVARTVAETKERLPEPPSLSLDGVSFSYKGNDRVVVDKLGLAVPKGTQFAIVGPSGSGKSTLLALLLGSQAHLRGGARRALSPASTSTIPRFSSVTWAPKHFSSRARCARTSCTAPPTTCPTRPSTKPSTRRACGPPSRPSPRSSTTPSARTAPASPPGKSSASAWRARLSPNRTCSSSTRPRPTSTRPPSWRSPRASRRSAAPAPPSWCRTGPASSSMRTAWFAWGKASKPSPRPPRRCRLPRRHPSR